MNKQLDEKLTSLIEALDQTAIVEKIKAVKKKLPIDIVEKLKSDELDIAAKKEIIFGNDELQTYQLLLNELNLIILEINKKLKTTSKKCGQCK